MYFWCIFTCSSEIYKFLLESNIFCVWIWRSFFHTEKLITFVSIQYRTTKIVSSSLANCENLLCCVRRMEYHHSKENENTWEQRCCCCYSHFCCSCVKLFVCCVYIAKQPSLASSSKSNRWQLVYCLCVNFLYYFSVHHDPETYSILANQITNHCSLYTVAIQKKKRVEII